MNRLRSFLLTLGLLAATWAANAQSVSPTVVANAGGTGTAGNMTLDWTLGEPMVTTLDNGLLVLTQGFHQPGGVLTSNLPAPFITTWNTANAGVSGATSITIPTTGGGYLYDVDWNNDGVYDQFNVTGSVTHDFGVSGTYTIRIAGAFPRIFFNGAGDRLKLLSVDQWGATPWTSMVGAFKGCSNMNITATDAPDLSSVTDLTECFMDCIAFTADLDQWDVLGITTMTRLFRGCTLFNGDVTTWATDSVTDMGGLFQLAGTFNRDISGWNTSKVTTMTSMFANADSFDQPIGVWDVGQVQQFGTMFIQNDAFDQPLNAWDVHSAVNFSSMFSQTTAFNQPLDQWTLGAVSLSAMFSQATAFDQDLGAWDISQVINFSNALSNCGMSTANYDATLIGWSTLDAGETQIPANKTFGATGLTYCLGEAARNTLTGTYGWTINDAGPDLICQSQGHFVTTWQTDNPGISDPLSITIPTFPGETYNYDVDWDNDGTFDQFGLTGDVTHTYPSPGTYTIRIRGAFPAIHFAYSGDNEKLLSVDQWGTMAWTTMEAAFAGCGNLQVTAADVPDLSGATSLQEMFASCANFNADINSWDVSQVTNMRDMFVGAVAFNQDLSSWEVGNVTNMGGMFSDTEAFDQPLDAWDVSNVTDMSIMFGGALQFDQDISSWAVGNVTDMAGMFINTAAFNQDLSSWDVGSVTNMFGMFLDATAFDQDLGSWDISNVTNMELMLDNCGMSTANYDATLMGWSTLDAGETQIPTNILLNAMGLTYCLGEAARNTLIGTYGWTITDAGPDLACLYPEHFVTTWKTDQPFGSSNPSSIIISTAPGETYNYDVDWNNDGVFDDLGVSGDITHDYGSPDTVTIRIRGTFPRIYIGGGGDSRKLHSVDQWGSTAWTSMFRAFQSCTNLKAIPSDPPDLSACSSLRFMFDGCSNFNADISMWDVGQVTDMGFMFRGSAFNQDISSWNVGQVTNMSFMFRGSSFNQDIGGWNVANVTVMQAMFWGSPFDQDISGWNVGQVTTMEDMFRGTPFDQDISSWNVGAVTLMGNMFQGSLFNHDIGSWNVSNVTDMYGMFELSPFNQDISGWNVSNVQYMDGMFYASSFNQDIGSWNTSAVTDMGYMFYGSPFNQDISSWNVSAVSNMEGMFNGATSFDQDLGGWDVSNVTNMTNMLDNSGLSTAHYDATLIGWATLDAGETQIPSGISLGAAGLTYCAGEAARTALTGTYGWTINDAGQDPGCAGVSLALRAFLQGPYISGTGLMNDGLRANGLVPLSEPYTALGWTQVTGGGETTTAPVLAVTGDDAIVDWVYLQLRDKSDNTLVLETRCALVQRDGDIVDTDGVSPVSFSSPSDSYYIAVFHRNHLGAMTLNSVALSSTAAGVDLTTGATATYGTDAQADLSGVKLLWAGDVTSDGLVKYAGGGNDRDPILVRIGG
ncbi:MAG TPA: BspA family leucine-rich repeat surface protein, partial [Flavobacteriales bacterium]|nr:BspA family leucine-rich repeat surface protein [Flavobacteriales bacterium]HMR29202.1 BspA family leucine-rich repeat surface protein [Flavobacteriales bacterium]